MTSDVGGKASTQRRGTLPCQRRLPEEDIVGLSLRLIWSFPGESGGHAGQGKQRGKAHGGRKGICYVEET